MNKFIKIAIYVMLMIFITYLFMSLAQASIVVDFLRDQQSEVEGDPYKLIAVTAIANQHDGSDVYVQKNPIYTESFETNNHSADISIYPFVLFRENETNNFIAIIITDLEIDDPTAYLDDDEYHQIKADITFEDEITIGDYTASSFEETFATGYDDTTKLIFINTSLFNTTEIRHINFSYTLDNEEDATLVNLANSTYENIDTNDLFDASFDRDLINVTSSNIYIANTYGTNPDHSDLYHDANWLNILDSYNRYYIRNALYELIVILPLTYFMFFHSRVRVKMKENKEKKKEEKALEQEKLKQKFRNESK